MLKMKIPSSLLLLLGLVVAAAAGCDDNGTGGDVKPVDSSSGKDVGSPPDAGSAKLFDGCLPDCLRSIVERCVPAGPCTSSMSQGYQHRCYANGWRVSEQPPLDFDRERRTVKVTAFPGWARCYSVEWTSDLSEPGRRIVDYFGGGAGIGPTASMTIDRNGIAKGKCKAASPVSEFTFDVNSPACKHLGRQGIGFADVDQACTAGTTAECPDFPPL